MKALPSETNDAPDDLMSQPETSFLLDCRTASITQGAHTKCLNVVPSHCDSATFWLSSIITLTAKVFIDVRVTTNLQISAFALAWALSKIANSPLESSHQLSVHSRFTCGVVVGYYQCNYPL